LNTLALSEWSRLLLALSILSYAAYKDIKTREIEPKIWVIATIVGGAITFFELIIFYFNAYNLFLWGIIDMVFSLLLLPFFYMMYRMAILGGADMLAYLFLSLDIPWYPLVLGLRAIAPMPFLALLYASMGAFIVGLLRGIKNLVDPKFWKFVRQNNIKGLKLIHYALSGRAFTAEEFLKTDFWYLLSKPVIENEKVRLKLEGKVNLEEEPEDQRKEVKRLLEEGKMRRDEILLASYGTPFLLYIYLGFILTLSIGDWWLRYLFG